MQQRQSTPAFETHAVTFPARRGNRLAGVLTAGDPGPLVLLCHGMESDKDGTKHRRLEERFAGLGIATLRFDFSYVGESEGEFADLTFSGEVDDLGGAWDFVRSRGFAPVGVIGSSFGGAVALLFAADEPGVACVGTMAAVGRPERIIEEIRPDERERWRRDGIFSLGGLRLRSAFLDDCERTDVLGACARVECPTLVVHGGADVVVPPTDGEEIAAALGGPAEHRVVAGADHRFSKPEHLEELIDALVDFTAEHLR